MLFYNVEKSFNVCPFTWTRLKRGEGHSFEQLNIIPNITSNYRSIFIKHLYYACTNVLLHYQHIYYISPYCISYCNSVYIFLVNCVMTVRGRMACSLSNIFRFGKTAIMWIELFTWPKRSPPIHNTYCFLDNIVNISLTVITNTFNNYVKKY